MNSPDPPLAQLAEAALGLAFLHRQRIVHGDIKGSNVLISLTGHALICDFGLAREYAPEQHIMSTSLFHGHLAFTAPEVTSSTSLRQKTRESDVYAFGMLILQVRLSFLI